MQLASLQGKFMQEPSRAHHDSGLMNSDSIAASRSQGDEILTRTFNGAKWMLYLSASALVAGFCTNVMLGRLGAEALGLYSALMLIVSLVQTFFVFGAANVFVNYLPNLSPQKKPQFIFSYSIVVYVAGAFSLALCLLFPPILQLVFRTTLNLPVGLYLTVLVPILLAQVLVWAMLQAELEGTALAISQNAVSWFYFLIIATMALIGLLVSSASPEFNGYIFAAVVLANVVALGIGFFFINKEHLTLGNLTSGWFLPDGVWRFTFALHIGTLFNFIISNAAPLFILRELGLRELGYFRAAAVFAAFVNWIPGVFDKSFYPSFCTLVSKNLPTNEVYGRFSRLNAMTSGIVALVIILFTRELLTVFGKEFSGEAYFLLIMLAAGYLVSTPFIQINFALVTAHLKTPHTMGAYGIGAVAGILLYSILVPRFGLSGIALAFVALQLIMFALSMVLTWHFTRSPFPTRAYLITVCAVGVGFIGAKFFGDVSLLNTAFKTGLFGLFFVLVLVTKLVTRMELLEMLSVVLPKSLQPWSAK
jgi:O-antigen/teichoic acid export membrane protein